MQHRNKTQCRHPTWDPATGAPQRAGAEQEKWETSGVRGILNDTEGSPQGAFTAHADHVQQSGFAAHRDGRPSRVPGIPDTAPETGSARTPQRPNGAPRARSQRLPDTALGQRTAGTRPERGAARSVPVALQSERRRERTPREHGEPSGAPQEAATRASHRPPRGAELGGPRHRPRSTSSRSGPRAEGGRAAGTAAPGTKEGGSAAGEGGPGPRRNGTERPGPAPSPARRPLPGQTAVPAPHRPPVAGVDPASGAAAVVDVIHLPVVVPCLLPARGQRQLLPRHRPQCRPRRPMQRPAPQRWPTLG